MMLSSHLNFVSFAFAVVLAFAADQISKAIAIANAVTLLNGHPVFPGFNLVLYRNTGISFGLFGNLFPEALIAVAVLISVWLTFLAYRSGRRAERLAYGLIVGGALGNILDRVRLGGVTDFLDFYVGEMHWPAFNLADTSIFCGAAVLIISTLLPSQNSKQCN